MKTTDKYVGLDVHKDTTVVAVAEGGREGEVRLYGTISSDLHALERVLAKLGGEGVRLHVVYEAGPTGYVVYRRLSSAHRAAALYRRLIREVHHYEGYPDEEEAPSFRCAAAGVDEPRPLLLGSVVKGTCS